MVYDSRHNLKNVEEIFLRKEKKLICIETLLRKRSLMSTGPLGL
jgi:hypothetical protein